MVRVVHAVGPAHYAMIYKGKNGKYGRCSCGGYQSPYLNEEEIHDAVASHARIVGDADARVWRVDLYDDFSDFTGYEPVARYDSRDMAWALQTKDTIPIEEYDPEDLWADPAWRKAMARQLLDQVWENDTRMIDDHS